MYLQLGQLAFSGPPFLRGKVAGLNGLCEVELAAFMRFVQGLQLTLQGQNLQADRHEHRQTLAQTYMSTDSLPHSSSWSYS